jgi:prepilin-type N-terminal cleavage/methylation domain-containing protein
MKNGMKNNNNKYKNGFTLIEMAMVMLILSILVAASIAPLAQQMQQKAETETKAALEAADVAILGFAAVNGRLPCPDTGNDGVADAGATAVDVCASLAAGDTGVVNGRTGFLPFATLGVTGVDAWGNRIRYSLDQRLAVSDRFAAISSASFVVNDGRLSTSMTPAQTLRVATNDAAYIVWSFGRNGLGGRTLDGINRAAPTALDEIANTPELEAIPAERRTFVSRIQTDATVPAGLYDDILIFKSSVSLAAKMSAAGQWP